MPMGFINPKTVKQTHIYFSGTVQGVGFRYTSQHLAQKMNLGGWVRNLSDGRVEMLVQGNQESIDMFLKQIQADFKTCLRTYEINYESVNEKHNDFIIIH